VLTGNGDQSERRQAGRTARAADELALAARPRRRVSRSTVVEFVALGCLALAYNVIRADQGGDGRAAHAHAAAVIALEGRLFDLIEVPLNGWLVAVPFLAVPACYFYAVLHYLMTPLVLILSWKRGGKAHQRAYWSLIVASGIALVVYASWPLAPPRLTPGIPIVDVMREFADYGWWGGAASAPRGIGDATNQFAAMPSLHFGWSLWCAIQMWGFGSRGWRIAAVVYPTLQALVVIATGNHFVSDVAAGAACVLFAHWFVGLLLSRSADQQPADA
jgi:hypothetical protein